MERLERPLVLEIGHVALEIRADHVRALAEQAGKHVVLPEERFVVVAGIGQPRLGKFLDRVAAPESG